VCDKMAARLFTVVALETRVTSPLLRGEAVT
jgi:hypothetical protein